LERVLEKLGEFLGKLEEGFFCGFSGFSGVDVNSGTAVMVRRTGRRDRGVRGIPGAVADRGAGAARVGAGLSAGGTRAEGERGRR
jgi:hypothetical protein